MKSIPAKCDHQLLLRSLDDRLTQPQEESLARHLDDCDVCRRQLESLAGEGEHWSRIEYVLKDETSGRHSSSATGRSSKLLPRAGSLTFGATLLAEMELRPADFAVNFLKPTDDENSLGRLNDIDIRAIIGHGGNGVVLKGFQPELNRLVAVKVIAPQLATSAAARRRFAREAQATAAIVHPNVMPVLTVNASGQLPYLVMPYVDCESLQQRLDREGPLPLLDVLRIGHQIANGLAAAHAQGLVHRDVKPANILLEKNVDRVMLTDFGLARAVDDASLTRTGLIAGTPQYMSPEQARGDAVDLRSDLFSLGSVLYAMCTGRPPFRAETTYGILRRVTDERVRSVSELNAEIPSWLEGIVNKLLEKLAGDRFANAGEVAELLEDCVAHVQHPRANTLPPVARQLAHRSRLRQCVRRGIVRLVESPLLRVGLGLATAAVVAAVFVGDANDDTQGTKFTATTTQGVKADSGDPNHAHAPLSPDHSVVRVENHGDLPDQARPTMFDAANPASPGVESPGGQAVNPGSADFNDAWETGITYELLELDLQMERLMHSID